MPKENTKSNTIVPLKKSENFKLYSFYSLLINWSDKLSSRRGGYWVKGVVRGYRFFRKLQASHYQSI